MKSIPVFGSIAVACNTIFIDRFAINKGYSVTDQIVSRLKSPGSKVGMFPEGTTTNNTAIVKFRTGAFVAGAPVVPVVFDYSFTFFDPAFSSCSLKFHLLGTLSQLCSFMSVRRLPVYYPSEAEKADPALYASNVKALMLSASGLKDSGEKYEDKLAWEATVGYESTEVRRRRVQEAKMKGDGGEIEITKEGQV